MFLGGGIGLNYPILDLDIDVCLTVPIFIDAKYSVLDQRVSPFIEAKIGTMFFIIPLLLRAAITFRAHPSSHVQSTFSDSD